MIGFDCLAAKISESNYSKNDIDRASAFYGISCCVNSTKENHRNPQSNKHAEILTCTLEPCDIFHCSDRNNLLYIFLPFLYLATISTTWLFCNTDGFNSTSFFNSFGDFSIPFSNCNKASLDLPDAKSAAT